MAGVSHHWVCFVRRGEIDLSRVDWLDDRTRLRTAVDIVAMLEGVEIDWSVFGGVVVVAPSLLVREPARRIYPRRWAACSHEDLRSFLG